MTVNYTTNLALGQPVTGTESGTWGDDVNNSVTSYLDIAIAGGLSVSITTTDVTLTLTQGTSSATNIGSTTAQYAILNVSGAMTAARNLILPSSSRQYVINNNTTGGYALTVKGSATSGVTMVNGEKAHVFWNGSDYAKLSNTPGGAGTFSSITNTGLTSGRVVYSTTGGLETDSANLTFDGTNLTLLGGTANGVAYLNGSKVLTTGSALTFDGTKFGVTGTAAAHTTYMTLTNSSTAGYGPMIDFNLGYAGGITGAELQSGATGTNGGYFTISAKPDGGTLRQVQFCGDAYTSWNVTGTEQMRLTSTGLGIGTSSPVSKLDVAEISTIKRVTSGNNMDLNFYNGSGAGTAGIVSRIRCDGDGVSNDYGALSFWTGRIASAAITERMRIDSSGNVGIGTTSTSDAKVSIGGTLGAITTASRVLQVVDSAGGALFLGSSSSNYSYLIHNTSSSTSQWLYRGGVGVTLDSSGNLGLGVTPSAWTLAPGFELKQSGVGIWNSGSNDLYLSNNAYYNSGWKYGTSSVAATQYRQNSGIHSWFNAPSGTAGNAITFTQAMTLDASGNLGIGTSSPGYNLDVLGLSNFSKTKSGTGVESYDLINLRLNGTNAIGDSSNIVWYSGGTKTAGISGICGADSTVYGSLAFSVRRYTTDTYDEVVRIDNRGNLGLGVTPSSWGVNARVLQGPLGGSCNFNSVAAETALVSNAYYNGSSWIYSSSTYASRYTVSGYNGTHSWYNAPSGTAGNTITFTQAMTLDASGNLLVGATTPISNSRFYGSGNLASFNGLGLNHTSASGTAYFGYFLYNSAGVGQITSTGTVCLFTSLSDYRLKENVQPMQNALATVSKLKPVTYKWKSDGSDGEGFIAHELAEVFPHAVTGEKDAVDKDGNIKPQGIDTSVLVATLTKAIQEQQALITSLTARITALEST
jgi:hypothetical protein